ncbi:MAG: hypothetical protein JWP87_4985 [Labilithrix sp.]|nr:hypothetical protein [Labilithrix sp.]
MRNIRRKSFDIKSVRLSAEEGFVLSRLDAPLSTRDLVSLTGLDEGRVVEIVEGLATQGVIDLDRDGAPPSVSPSSASMPSVPSVRPIPEATDSERDLEVMQAASEAGASVSVEGEEPPDEVTDPVEEEERAQGEREYQKIYEQLYHPMSREERIAAAEKVDGSDLLALCLDAEPQVIHAVLTNPKSGLPHARMIALHHRTHTGLELVGRRSEFLSDANVQRRLLANPQLPGTLLRRMVSPKLLMEVYKIAINREIPERSRVMTRELLCKKFMLGSGDERAALLIKTEGRCLILLVNCALDSRTTQILTAKTSFTILFIQNLARWSATPPALLVHLLKQPVVRMNVGLRKMLLKHPNVPSETKRNLS